MRTAISISCLCLVLLTAAPGSSQDGQSKVDDLGAPLSTYSHVPHVEVLIAKVLSPMKSKVITVDQDVRTGESKTTETEYLAGRIEKIEFDSIESVAKVIAVRENFTIKVISLWKLKEGTWVPYEPEPTIPVPRDKEQGSPNQAL